MKNKKVQEMSKKKKQSTQSVTNFTISKFQINF